ncbi:MAG: alpha/beta fold hydrolase [Desulfopila sp.]|jgi:pimeloyl-ACP methyl ester carboxylesterase|nr:alpha/beta fold hydrolase [Desulfopila sp.]
MMPFFSVLLMLSIVLLSPVMSESYVLAENQPKECVILLHGLARTSGSMDTMARELQQAGFVTVNIDYPSTEKKIEDLSEEAVSQGVISCREQQADTLHFVTHSMGGILVRYYLLLHNIDELGRVVMLSPPNKGSEVVDTIGDWSSFQWYNGPAGGQLGTGEDSMVLQLGPVNFPLGIITGNSPAFYDGWFADMIPGQNDGKVSVERAKVEGMTDFLVLPHNHTFIMSQEDVIDQTIFFLRHGKFDNH